MCVVFGVALATVAGVAMVVSAVTFLSVWAWEAYRGFAVEIDVDDFTRELLEKGSCVCWRCREESR